VVSLDYLGLLDINPVYKNNNRSPPSPRLVSSAKLMRVPSFAFSRPLIDPVITTLSTISEQFFLLI